MAIEPVHNTAIAIVFPCGKIVEILVRYSTSGWAWTIYWIEDGVTSHRRTTNERAMMKTMFHEMISAAQVERDAAKAVPVSGYAKVSVLVHLDAFNVQDVDGLVKDVKADLGRYIGVHPVAVNIQRLGDKQPDPLDF